MKVNTLLSLCKKTPDPSVVENLAGESNRHTAGSHPLTKVRDGRRKKAATLRGIGIALLGAASALSAVPSAQAGPNDPPNCNNFMQKYFSSGPPSQLAAKFSLVSEATSLEETYASGSLQLKFPQQVLGPKTLSGEGKQYFSDKLHCIGVDCHPFDPASTAQLEVTVSQSAVPVNGRNLHVTLRSPPASGPAQNVTPLDCIGDNVLYGSAEQGFLGGKIVVIGVGALTPLPK